MVEAGDSDRIISKRKAINTLFPYAIFLEESGQQGMMDAILRAARVSDSKSSNLGKFMWHHVKLYTSRLFERRSPTSLNRVITLISPYVPWEEMLNNPIAAYRWAAAVSATQYTEEVGQNVVDALLQIASDDFLRHYIPINIWELLKKEPSLPSMYHGLVKGGSGDVVAHVRGLGDVGLLKSLFLLLWTDQCTPSSDGTRAMEESIRTDFSGSGMEQHRRDLIERLDYVLGRLEQNPQQAHFQEAKDQYTKLKGALSGVDR